MRLIDGDELIEKAKYEAVGMAYPDKITIPSTVERIVEKMPTIEPERKSEWIPVTERLPEENHRLRNSGEQFSDTVLVSVLNHGNDEDKWVYISHTIDGEWSLELPIHCEIVAWMPIPQPWEGEEHGTPRSV